MTDRRTDFLDLSHHNTLDKDWAAQLKAANIVGVIHKATQRDNYSDDTYAQRKQEALAAGLKWGAYCFMEKGDGIAQADYLLEIAGLDDVTRYVCDWEDYGDGGSKTATPQQVAAFLDRIDVRTGRYCTIYSGNTAKEQLGDEVDEFFALHPLWIPRYSTSKPVPQASWGVEYWAWQFTGDGKGSTPHTAPGVQGVCDCNEGWSRENVIEEWGGPLIFDVEPEPDRPMVDVNIVVSDGVEVTVSINGEVIARTAGA
jgi:GH25 family lysozyme M1 (1,4-beta-N-acetylmuramidase)